MFTNDPYFLTMDRPAEKIWEFLQKKEGNEELHDQITLENIYRWEEGENGIY